MEDVNARNTELRGARHEHPAIGRMSVAPLNGEKDTASQIP